MPTAAQVRAQRDAKLALAAIVEAELEDLWATLDLANARQVAAALESILPDLVAEYGEMAAILAADYYDEIVDGYGVRARGAVLAPPVPAGQAQAVARWAVGPLFGANPDGAAALSLLTAGAERLTLQSARETIARNTERDGLVYARVPSGADTCAFCLMLASRGAVYGSKRAAQFQDDGTKYHDKCYCEPTPMRGPEDAPEGYDPEALYKQVYEPNAASSAKETLAEIRKATSAR